MSSRLTRPTVSSQQKVQPKKQYIGHGPRPTRAKEQVRWQPAPKFDWRVNEESGYFELGTPSPEDDFYIFNTTLVSCQYFHLLEGRHHDDNKPREGTFWSVQYRAFGCDIISDIFQLSNEKDSRQTFIGDKITARIRCNSALFHEYLKSTSIEFRIYRTIGVNGVEGMAGVSFVELKELTRADIKGLKANLEIVPNNDLGFTKLDHKPELRIVIEMHVIPNFFPGESSLPRISFLPEVESNENPSSKDTHPAIRDSEEVQSDIDSVGLEVESRQSQQEQNFSSEEEQGRSEDDEQGRQSYEPLETEFSKFQAEFSLEELDSILGPVGHLETRPSNAGDTLDGMAGSHHKRVAIAEDDAGKTNLPQKVDNDIANWTKAEIVNFKEELKEKERVYLEILQEEWSKRDEEREYKTSQVLQEQNALKTKLESKELQLIEMETVLRKREREVEEFANKATLGMTQRVEEMKIRMKFMHDKHQNDLELSTVKLESAHTEIERLNGKIQSLEAKLRAKEMEVDNLNAMRTQWPDISMERKLVRMEEKNKALVLELEMIRKERDSYRHGALSLVKRQNQMQSQRDVQLYNENEALRTQIWMNMQRKDLRKERESIEEVAKNIDAITKAYSKKDTKTHEANLTEKIENRRRRSPATGYDVTSSRQSSSDSGNSYKKYFNSAVLSGMSRSEIDSEIKRLVSERDHMVGTGDFLRTDSAIRGIDNVLTRLASDLMARDQIPSY